MKRKAAGRKVSEKEKRYRKIPGNALHYEKVENQFALGLKIISTISASLNRARANF